MKTISTTNAPQTIGPCSQTKQSFSAVKPEKVNQNFRMLDGGLFSAVTKADVGDGVGKLITDGYTIMSWADPFFPDPALPDSVRQTMMAELAKGEITHYSMPIGLTETRQAVAQRMQQRYGLALDPARNVLITPGSDSGLLYAMMAFLNQGDEVLIFDPSYPSNFLNAQMCGAVPVSVPLYESEGFSFHLEDLEERVSSRTRMVVLTHPNNPTGTVLRPGKIRELCDFIVKHDLLLVCDQAFEDHIYDGIEFLCPALLPGMWERTLTVFSVSKGFGLSGFRVGYIVADDPIMNILYGGTVNFLGATNTLSQMGAIAALRDTSILPAYRQRLQRRRDLICQKLADIPGVQITRPESGILLWLNVERLGTDAEVAAYLLEHAKVSVNEGRFYGPLGGPGHLRIVFSCYSQEQKAIEVYERIAAALRQLAQEKGLA